MTFKNEFVNFTLNEIDIHLIFQSCLYVYLINLPFTLQNNAVFICLGFFFRFGLCISN
jgi:hypothetical protein